VYVVEIQARRHGVVDTWPLGTYVAVDAVKGAILPEAMNGLHRQVKALHDQLDDFRTASAAGGPTGVALAAMGHLEKRLGEIDARQKRYTLTAQQARKAMVTADREIADLTAKLDRYLDLAGRIVERLAAVEGALDRLPGIIRAQAQPVTDVKLFVPRNSFTVSTPATVVNVTTPAREKVFEYAPDGRPTRVVERSLLDVVPNPNPEIAHEDPRTTQVSETPGPASQGD
jgi:hypothetical protein